MNKLAQKDLWEKIQNFHFDDAASSFPFSKKIAKENHWSPLFTNKAIEEYRKFIFLCCISPNGASPSETVDKVWHLHLTYTDNYWNLFCKQTLNQEIHHHPSKGGKSEKERHQDWYQSTLTLYEACFETKPPAEIWPAMVEHATDIEDPEYDPRFFKKVLLYFSAGVILYILLVNLYKTDGPDFLSHYFIIGLAGLGVLYLTQWHKNNRLTQIVESNFPKDFTPFQMARFLYGVHRCYQTALIDLLRNGYIETSGSDYKFVKHPVDGDGEQKNPLLNPLMQNISLNQTFTYKQGLVLIDGNEVIHPQLEKLHRLSKKVDYQKLIVPCIVLTIGFFRMLQGLANDRPVSFLVLEMVVFSIISLMLLQKFSYTKMVRKQLSRLWQDQNNQGTGEQIINNFTILGTAAIAGFAEYAILQTTFDAITMQDRKQSNSGSAGCGSTSGCGSSCSGGGDGGGGCSGGCGGCGGGD